MRHGEDRIGGGPHGQALVGEDHLGVDAVAFVVGLPPFDGGAGAVALLVLTDHGRNADLGGAITFHHVPHITLGICFYVGDAVAVFRLDPLGPQIRRLVGVRVGRDHQIFVRVIHPRGARPALRSRGFKAPIVGLVNVHLFAHFYAPNP